MSLMVYLVVLMIVIGIISSFTRFFYKNVDESAVFLNNSEQYLRFLTYFTQDINSKKIELAQVDTKSAILNFEDGNTHEYNYSNKCIYYMQKDNKGNIQKKVKICDNVTDCSFEYNEESSILNSIIEFDNVKIYKNIFRFFK